MTAIMGDAFIISGNTAEYFEDITLALARENNGDGFGFIMFAIENQHQSFSDSLRRGVGFEPVLLLEMAGESNALRLGENLHTDWGYAAVVELLRAWVYGMQNINTAGRVDTRPNITTTTKAHDVRADFLAIDIYMINDLNETATIRLGGGDGVSLPSGAGLKLTSFHRDKIFVTCGKIEFSRIMYIEHGTAQELIISEQSEHSTISNPTCDHP